jgi:hypothetical protein
MNFPPSRFYLLLFLPISLTNLGCVGQPKTSTEVPSLPNSPSPIAQLDSSPSNSCTEKPPGNLSKNSVKSIQLSDIGLVESGKIQGNNPQGYTFEAKAGQEFFAKATGEVCTQIYTPSNHLLKEETALPESGKYVVQVFSVKAEASFDLEMVLDGTLPSQPINQALPSGKLQKSQALKIVKAWLSAKSKIFAAPWDTDLLAQYTTGNLYRDITKPNGSLDWLKKYDAYYSYGRYEIKKIVNFSGDNKNPSLKLEIMEDQTLNTRKGIDSSSSGMSTKEYSYSFSEEGGRWKIQDYQ